MIYDDGVNVDNQMRVMECPRCENEIFSSQADHCKICGLTLYNLCEGQRIEDFGHDEIVYHRNPGDARFCETCGQPTQYFKEQILQPWEVVHSTAIDNRQNNHSNVVQIDPFANQQQVVQQPIPVCDDDLPF